MLMLNRKNWSARILILSILILPFIAAFKLLQGDFDSLEAVLIWIISGGGAMILVGYVEAFLLENWAGWHKFPRWVKTFFPIIMAALFGVIAQSLLAFEALDGISPTVGMLVLTMINWISSQKGYISAKKEGYASAARNAALDG